MTVGRVMDFILRKHTEALLNPIVQKPFAWGGISDLEVG